MLKIPPEALAINRRFFEALDVLKRKKELTGIFDFCARYNISSGNLYTIKTREKGLVKIEYLMYLVRDFGISAHWLLTGECDMFRQTTSRT